jgi:hypothetical protein
MLGSGDPEGPFEVLRILNPYLILEKIYINN